MLHMGFDKMTSRKSTAQTQFSAQHTRTDDTGQLSCIGTWRGITSPPYAQQVKHRCLWRQEGTAADCAHFDGGHGYGDLKIAVVTIFQSC